MLMWNGVLSDGIDIIIYVVTLCKTLYFNKKTRRYNFLWKFAEMSFSVVLRALWNPEFQLHILYTFLYKDS